LKEVAERAGCKLARLVLRAEDVEWICSAIFPRLESRRAPRRPKFSVEEIMDAFAMRFELHVETVSTADESVFFPLPREIAPSDVKFGEIKTESGHSRNA